MAGSKTGAGTCGHPLHHHRRPTRREPLAASARTYEQCPGLTQGGRGSGAVVVVPALTFLCPTCAQLEPGRRNGRSKCVEKT